MDDHSSSHFHSTAEGGSDGPAKRLSRGPSIRIHTAAEEDDAALSPTDLSHDPHDVLTPITPSYRFVNDEHLTTHHHHGHTHSPSAHHEGHSHNMRGVFLHVMAVS